MTMASRSVDVDGSQGGPSHPIIAGQCRWTSCLTLAGRIVTPNDQQCWAGIEGTQRGDPSQPFYSTQACFTSNWLDWLNLTTFGLKSELWSVLILTRFWNAPNGQSGDTNEGLSEPVSEDEIITDMSQLNNGYDSAAAVASGIRKSIPDIPETIAE